jgi:ATP-dependent DNA helicase HFM1/MER3
LDLAGLEEDPDFWNMDIEDEDLTIRDLTKNQGLSPFFSSALAN